jgi:inner membrane protein
VDTLTHALSGALLARAATPARTGPGTPGTGGRMLAGFAGGAFPDIDFAMRAVDTLWYLSEVHQGATHSVVLLPLWALAVAWVFGQVSGLGWRGYFVPVSLGIGIHVAGDLITAYGTMVLYPFSDWRPALSWVYVVDPYFTLIIAAGLLVAWRWPDRGRAGAVAALVVLFAYVGVQGVIQIRAVGVAEAYARHAGLSDARSEALPQPFSPAHRVLVVSDDEAVHTAWVRLLPGRSLAERMPLPQPFRDMASHYMQVPQWQRRPRFGRGSGESDLARLAWGQDGFRHFRRFARIPVLHEVAEEGGRECAWFKDLRFELPALPPSFVFGMCRDPVDGSWHRERRRGAMWLD